MRCIACATDDGTDGTGGTGKDTVERVLLESRERVVASSSIETRRFCGRKLLAVALDLVAIAAAMFFAVRIRAFNANNATEIVRSRHPVLMVASLPLWIAVFSHFRLYTARHLVRGVDEFRRIVRACATGVISLALLSYWMKLYVARGVLVALFFLVLIFTTAERVGFRRWYTRQRRRGQLLRSVLIAGTNVEALTLYEMLESEKWHGYRVVGFLGDDLGDETPPHCAVLGTISEAVAVAQRFGVSGVLIATTSVEFAEVNRLTRDLTDAGLHVEISSALYDIAPERLFVRPLGTFSFCYVEPVKRRGWRSAAKRGSDIVLSSLGLLVMAPVFLVVAIAIKLDSRGPVFFSQDRVGKDGAAFPLLKFRTMVRDATDLLIDLREQNEACGPLFKMRNDPRITGVGRFLRRWSIDELPQLVNVLRGEMSLVGPRPALPSEVRGWHQEAHGRLHVQPGLTGMWQVLGRSDNSFEQYIRLDLYYVDNWSLLTDIVILAKTIPVVLVGRGSY